MGKEKTSDIFRNFLDSRLESIHTILPGKIVLYAGHATKKASVKPSVSLKSKVGEEIVLPVIDNVPVMLPSGNTFSFLYDIKPGDNCMLAFSETGIGNYLNSNGVIDAQSDDASRFSLMDAICIPGLWPFGAVPNSPSTFEHTVSQRYILKNPVEDLATLINDLITQIAAITTAGGPAAQAVSPASQAALLEIQVRFLTLLEIPV